jgi:hypothetical protein
MTVALTSKRLIRNATGVALDIMFRNTTEFTQLSAAPSSDLIWERWSMLPADSATVLAMIIRDADLIDKIAAKDKRKCVRLQLASNPATHPVTRLFFLQEGLRNKDWDLQRTAVSNMGIDEFLGHVAGDASLLRSYDISRFAVELVESLNSEKLIIVRDALDERGFQQVTKRMITENPKVTLDLFEKARIEISGIEFGRHTQFTKCDTATMRRLIAIGGSELREAVVNRHSEDLPYIASIDPDLLDLVELRHIEIDESVARLYFEMDKTSLLLNCSDRCRFSADAITYMLSVIDNPIERAKLILRHPKPRDAKNIITDPSDFVSHLTGVEAKTVISFVSEGASEYGTEMVVNFISAIAERYNSYVLSSQQISVFSEKLELEPQEMLDRFPDHVFARIDSLTGRENLSEVLNRSIMVGNNGKIASIILSMRSSDEAVTLDCVDVLLAEGKHDEIRNWLSRADDELAMKVVDRHRSVIVNYLSQDRDLNRSSWASELIDEITPPGTWSQIRNERMLDAAMRYLSINFKDDQNAWEAALVLFDGWTGSLPELVKAAKAF